MNRGVRSLAQGAIERVVMHLGKDSGGYQCLRKMKA